MLIIEDPTVNLKCGKAAKTLFLYLFCWIVSNVDLLPYPFLLRYLRLPREIIQSKKSLKISKG